MAKNNDCIPKKRIKREDTILPDDTCAPFNEASQNDAEERYSEEYYTVRLSAWEVLRKAYQDFRFLSGIKWYYVLGGGLLLAVIAPWIPPRPTRHHHRELGDYSMFESMGNDLIEGDWGSILLITLIMAFVIWILIIFGSGWGEHNCHRDHMESFLKKDHPDWSAEKARQEGETLAKANYRTFANLHFYFLLAVMVLLLSQQVLLYLLSAIIPWDGMLLGFIVVALMVMDIIIFRYLKEAVARVVYNEWQFQAMEVR